MKKHLYPVFLYVLLFAFPAITLLASSCEEPVPPTPTHEPEKEEISLTAPQNEIAIDLNKEDAVSFRWVEADGINSYKILFSLDSTFTNSVQMTTTGNPLVMPAKDLDNKIQELGVEAGTTVKVLWSIVPGVSNDFGKQIRSLNVTRKTAEPTIAPYEERVADKIIVKVAVVYEDPIVPGTDGKRIHQFCHTPGYSYNWNNPWEQCKEFEAAMEEASHGVIDYQVVREYDCDSLFTFYTSNSKYITIDNLLEIFAKGPIPGIGQGVEYDYKGMIQHFGFGKMRDNGEINEVWVYTHPASGMYESRLVGKGAFWLNSPGLNDSSICEDLLTVMFCNYERTVDLAIHSYGHRAESIMNQVYGSWSYEYKSLKTALNKWERFCGYKLSYDKYDKGNSNIGLIHFPPNGEKDYDYSNRSYINTYADEWINYPYVPEKVSRKVNCSEWKNDQYGYMMWWFGHLPHFKGINPDIKDLHLNNWWYYLVDYNAALRYERKLQSEL